MAASDHFRLDRSIVPTERTVRFFGDDSFCTSWRRWECIPLFDGETFRPTEPGLERVVIVLHGHVEVGEGIQLTAGDTYLCAGFSATNHSEGRALLLHAAVAVNEPARPRTSTLKAQLDPASLRWRPAIHGGSGRIATRHIWGPDDFVTSFTFLDHAILDPGGSVGYHYHEALEESFFILRGDGLMTIEDRTFDVGPDSVTWQGVEEGHGIYNPHDQELEFVRIAVAQSGQQFTTIDLNDDLSARIPLEE